MSIKEQLADSFKLVLYQLVYYAVKCIPARQCQRRLLLVKTDEIGDYMLLRNQLERFRASAVYQGYHITFIGNRNWRQLFETYDARVADETIWLDKIRFRRNMFYRFSLLWRVRRAGYSDAVNLIYSRSFRVDDLFVAVSTASTKIAMQPPRDAALAVGRPAWGLERLLTPPTIYHRLEDAGNEELFDGIRNARFVAKIVDTGTAAGSGPAGMGSVMGVGSGSAAGTPAVPGEAISIRLSGQLPAIRPEWSLPAAFFVVVPGSGNPNKWWPMEYFAETVRYVARRFELTPVICGGQGDQAVTSTLCAALDGPALSGSPAGGPMGEGPALDLTGRTSLPELLTVLRMAHCLISIDTGAVHLAASVGCPVFGLFSGFHYGRFSPYPPGLAPHLFSIYPDDTEKQLAGGRLIPEQVPMGLMSGISPAKVIGRLERELPALLSAERQTVTQIN